MAEYKAEVAESSRQLTARERIKFKDLTDAISIDEATKDEPLIITVKDYAIVKVHNENSDNKDYTKYVLEDSEGNLYATGSESFWKSFIDIWSEMAEETEEWKLKIYKKDSANYKGKQFITCSIV